MVDISVVICTHNRAEMLRGALESLCRQAISPNLFEIIVVDNGSTDHTADVLGDVQTDYPWQSIRVLHEGLLGLGIARNKALFSARGKYIAYMDDDARATPHWLPTMLALIQERPDEIICLGGPILPFYTSFKPTWFKDQYESRSLGVEMRDLRIGESFSGSNMIWSRKRLLAIGGFSEGVGVKGAELSLGEETDTFLRLWRKYDAPSLLYAPELIMWHWVPPFKMHVSYRLKRAFVAGQIAVKIGNFEYGIAHAFLGACKGLVFGLVEGILRFRRYPFWQNWIIEEGGPLLINLGTILAVCDIYVSVRQD
ncbi:MAG: glycosyltransferase family 2 protein [Candidatus Promineifilaceae bacterium]|nr:glycosyltransferase family 2 protein [Candidatus Promineifilaceae bacterium]